MPTQGGTASPLHTGATSCHQHGLGLVNGYDREHSSTVP